MIDWRTSQAVRDATAKRAELASVDRALEDVQQLYATALEFDGYFANAIAALEQRRGALVAVYTTESPQPFRKITEAQDAEAEQLRNEIRTLERERDARKADAVVTSVGQFGQTYSHCLLSPDDMKRRLHHLGAIRGRVAQELHDLESRLTPGQLVESGVPASQYAEHTARTAALRQQAGVA